MPATAAMTDAAHEPDPPEGQRRGRTLPPWLQQYGLRALIGIAGVVAATGIIVRDDQDPIVFAIPVLVATTVIISALSLAGSETRTGRRAAADTGLDYDGVRPVPSVTKLLAAGHPPAHMISGELDAYGPDVRIAFLKTSLVALVDLSEQPAGAHTTLGDGTRAWLADQATEARAELEDETLVVVVARDTPPRQLLELTRALVARL